MKQTFKQLVDLFRAVFGANWYVALAFLAAFITWPIVVFKDVIVFMPDRFVEEWLKICVNGIVLFFLLQYFEQRLNRSQRLKSSRDWLEQGLLSPISRVIDHLDQLISHSTAGDRIQRTDTQPLIDVWDHVEHLVKHGRVDEALVPEVGNQLLAGISVDIDRCTRLVHGLSPTLSGTTTLSPGEIVELRQLLTQLRDEVRRTMSTMAKAS